MLELRRLSAGAMLLSVLAGCEADVGALGGSDWMAFGGDKAYTRYSPHDQINATNVADLRIAWQRPAVDPAFLAANPDVSVSAYLLSTPQMIDGVLYVSNGVGLVEAMHPATGETLWTQELPEGERPFGRSNRGLGYWTDGDDHRLLSVRGRYMYAINRDDGEVISEFGEGGRVDLQGDGEAPFSSATGVMVVGDVAVVGGIRGGAGDRSATIERERGDITGWDVRTGELRWTFHVIPRDGEALETWGNESWRVAGDAGTWCCVSADEELGLVYLPLSSATGFFGGWRPGDNLYSNSLVALNAATGELAWYQQLIHHGIWEHELVGAPILGDITVDGRLIRAVMQPTKMALLFTFDRATGEPVWPIEERPVPASNVPGEKNSPTQPYPTKPAPYDQHGLTEDDIIDLTPEIRARTLEFLRPYVLAPDLYTPPAVASIENGIASQGLITLPGTWGAGNWHTGAFDPETGYFYAQTHRLAGIVAIVPSDGPAETMPFVRFGASPLLGPDSLPLVKPPYGQITAIDMNTGEHVWQVPNGDGVNDHPLLRDLDLPPLGTPSRPSALVTRSLLFIGEGSDAFGGVDFWGRTFRAYDKATGAVVWETELPGGTTSQPMSYMYDGKQYIVVPVGDSEHPAEFVALALP